jgi:triosephosphate isomerase
MRSPLIAANWKMNTDIDSAVVLATELVDGFEPGGAAVVLCPPFIALEAVGEIIDETGMELGAQNLHFENDGAFTGEISGGMLASVGCTYVIVGHSERRQFFGDTDDSVGLRAAKAIVHGIIPIICVGERLEEREAGTTFDVVRRQVRAAYARIEASKHARTVVAYEPVWAIGTGRTATPAQAQEVHAMIRAELAKIANQSIADSLRILYGGSVKPDNAAELFAEPDIDGGLIGGASLKAEGFLAIVAAA